MRIEELTIELAAERSATAESLEHGRQLVDKLNAELLAQRLDAEQKESTYKDEVEKLGTVLMAEREKAALEIELAREHAARLESEAGAERMRALREIETWKERAERALADSAIHQQEVSEMQRRIEELTLELAAKQIEYRDVCQQHEGAVTALRDELAMHYTSYSQEAQLNEQLMRDLADAREAAAATSEEDRRQIEAYMAEIEKQKERTREAQRECERERERNEELSTELILEKYQSTLDRERDSGRIDEVLQLQETQRSIWERNLRDMQIRVEELRLELNTERISAVSEIVREQSRIKELELQVSAERSRIVEFREQYEKEMRGLLADLVAECGRRQQELEFQHFHTARLTDELVGERQQAVLAIERDKIQIHMLSAEAEAARHEAAQAAEDVLALGSMLDAAKAALEELLLVRMRASIICCDFAPRFETILSADNSPASNDKLH